MRFPEQLAVLPLVQKSDLLAQSPHDLLDRGFLNHRLAVEKTSGSSGQPIQIHKDAGSVRRRSLRFLRALFSCGYRPGHRLLLISTRRTAGLMALARWQYADLRDENLLREYQRARPDVLYGPLSSLLQICEHAPAGNVFHRPSIVISTAEQLTNAQRLVMERTFGCPVADFYGMTEVGLVAFRRAGTDAYQMASRDLLVEFLPQPDEPTAERLIVTDLTGGAMPMIRYDTGDLVRRDLSQPTPLIREFLGRQVDSIRLASGRTLSPYRVTLCLEALPSIRQYQVVQRKDMSLDVYFNSDERHTESVGQAISTALAELCEGLPMRVEFQKDGLQKTTGKFRPVKSEILSQP